MKSLLLTLVLCAIGAAAARPHRQAATIERRVLQLDDDTVLPYAIAVPADLDARRRAPLVLALHFGWPSGAAPDDIEYNFLRDVIEPGLRDLEAVIVAPRCPARAWTQSESERLVLALLDELAEEHGVDEQRTAVTGFSLGGMGTWFFAARHPDRFRVAVPMAGRPRDDWVDALEVPLYAIHARQDEIVPIAATALAIEALQGRGAAAEIVIVEDVGHYQTGRYVRYLRDAVAWVQRHWDEDR